MPLGSAFDKTGRCIATDIILVICSPGTDGKSVDPTTMREYQMFCTHCGCRTFKEVGDDYTIECNNCDKVAGTRRLDSDEFC